MSSIDKLKRLTGEDIKPQGLTASKNIKIDELRRRIDDVMARRRERDLIEAERRRKSVVDNLREFVSGEEVENEAGKFFLAGEEVRGSHRHGGRNIGENYGFDMKAAALLANDPIIGEFRSADALFLDTETTGLAGGTGTMAFLIGVGWFESGSFFVRQILARDFGEEKAALSYLAEITDRKKFLITFNGKAFDVNLLATRFIMNRLRSVIADLPHLDLLHPSRRILGHRLENSRLSTLEEQILGVEREGDIPGWEIPQRYFDWLKRRDGRLLAAIFEHNRLDVISMANLTAHLTEIITAEASAQNIHADDYLAAASLTLHRRSPERTEKILSVFHSSTCTGFSKDSKKKLAQLYKKTGKINEAAQIWQEMVACTPLDFYAVSELAKWLEHHDRDYSRAKTLVENALQAANTFSEEEKKSLLHRLERLRKK